MGFGVPVNELKKLMNENDKPIPMKKWLTIGTLDELEWKPVMNGSWKQRAGIIRASGLGSGFGGRMLCLYQGNAPSLPYEIEVEVRLEEESGRWPAWFFTPMARTLITGFILPAVLFA